MNDDELKNLNIGQKIYAIRRYLGTLQVWSVTVTHLVIVPEGIKVNGNALDVKYYKDKPSLIRAFEKLI